MARQKNKTSEEQQGLEVQKDLPARYIRQPYPISAMQANLSKQQIRILVGMMQSIQDGVQRMFERGADEKNQLLLFPDMTDDHVNIDFKFSDVAVRPDAYSDVADIADKFMHMVFSYEDKEHGEVTLKHFVDEVTYPKRGSKRDKIRFSFTRKQAEAVFDFTKYSRYLLSVAAEAESKHTARIYMLITSARGFDRDGTGIFHWYVAYEELRRMLGCDEKDDKGRWIRKRQKQYKHFKADVLRVAEGELKKLADNGNADCWFEFVELPEGFAGEPERFDFIVHLTEMGRLYAAKTRDVAAESVQTEFEPTPLPVADTTGKRRGRKPGKKKVADANPLLLILRALDVEGNGPEELIAQMQDNPAALMAEAKRLQQYIAECRAGLHPDQPVIANQGGYARKCLQNFISSYKAKQQITNIEPSLNFGEPATTGHDTVIPTLADAFIEMETW